MKKLVNLTPHDVTLVRMDGTAVIIPRSDKIARVEENFELEDICMNIPLSVVTYGEITELPEPQENTLYIVSSFVFNAAVAKGRKDCCYPAMFDRDENGKIIAVKTLVISV